MLTTVPSFQFFRLFQGGINASYARVMSRHGSRQPPNGQGLSVVQPQILSSPMCGLL